MATRSKEKTAYRREHADKRPHATARYIRMSPRKVKVVVDMIRGKSAKEAAAITVHLAQNEEATGLVNVGAGKARTWLELVRPIFAAMGVPENIEFVEMPESLRAQYQYFTQAKIDKLTRLGGAQYLVPLEESVTDYVKNYLIPDKHLGE